MSQLHIPPLIVVRRSGWTGPETVPRSQGLFKVSPADALRGVAEEVARVRGTNARLLVDCSERDLAKDGQLRADASPFHPGVVLTFTHPGAGELKYPRDPYWSFWHNVRALALTLEALRGIERWGGAAAQSQQYIGFRALPASTALTMGVSTARKVLEDAAGFRIHDNWNAQELEALVIRAKAKAHPDANAGDRVAWDQVEQAARVLGSVAK